MRNLINIIENSLPRIRGLRIYRMPKNTTVYHGTSANITNHNLDSPCWVSTSYDVANYFVNWHDPEEDKYDEYDKNEKGKRILEFKTNKPLRLLYVESKIIFDIIADRYGFDMETPEEMAEAVCRLGYDGWYIENNYIEGDDTLLCDSDVLDFVQVHRQHITEKIIDAYHGTDKDFDEFKSNPQENINAYDSTFFHFGSNPQQANNRLIHTGNSEGARVLPVKLNLKHSLRLPDQNEWNEFTILNSIRKLKKPIGVAAEKIFQEYFTAAKSRKNSEIFARAVRKYRKNHGLPYTGAFNSWPQDAGEMKFRAQFKKDKNEFERQLIINLLNEFGYDSIVYKNEYEGEGDSYIVFDNSQIKSRFT